MKLIQGMGKHGRGVLLAIVFASTLFLGGGTKKAEAGNVDFTYNVSCLVWPGLCVSAATIWSSISTNKNSYSPGETMVVDYTIWSDDVPVLPLCPGIVLRIGAIYSSGDILPNCYTAQDFRNSVYGTYNVTAPNTVGAYDLNVQATIGGKYQSPSSQNIPFTVNVVSGTINVSSNIAGANWTITGPATLPGSGTYASYASQPVGGYTITWGDVAGYTKPSSSSQALSANGTITFSGTYTVLAPPPVTINVHF